MDAGAIAALLDAAVEIVSRDPGAGGIDDYLSTLATHVPAYSTCLDHARPFVMVHSIEDPIVMGALLGQDAVVAIESMGETLIGFDARLGGTLIERRPARVLPELRWGDFARTRRKETRESIGLSRNAVPTTAEDDLLLYERDTASPAFLMRLAELPAAYVALTMELGRLRHPQLSGLLTRFGIRLAPTEADQFDDLIVASDLPMFRSGQLPHAVLKSDVAEITKNNSARGTRVEAFGSVSDRHARELTLCLVIAILTKWNVGKLIRYSASML
ncbi:hypothetical protein [Paraburkholderia lycopersici]|uniref:hypothetical protein n=1 Tax=Paraburkholderia lycopersici TaxID=416944 RepID=UPI00116148F9|nr:hypothetical protein [Paraburkholderia lycopersici]